jgi:hypothetical protein
MIYTGLLTSEQLRHGNHLRLHYLFTAMDMQWHAMGGGTKHEANDDGEIALVMFQGVCFIQYATRRGIGHTNVPTRRRTEMVTVITAKEFARQHVSMVLIVDIAASPTTLTNSAGENPVTSISSLVGSRRNDK